MPQPSRTSARLLALTALALPVAIALAPPVSAQAAGPSQHTAVSGSVSASVALKPDAKTTGVPAGTKLTVHEGNIVVTKAGTVLDALDVHGSITVRADNVRITRSIVRGGPSAPQGSALIMNYGSLNLVVKDTDINAAYPSVNIDGLKGWNFRVLRVHIRGTVDSIKVHGDNASIKNSLLEDTVWYAHDPYQSNNATHNDNIQVMKGKNIIISGNTIRGAQNFAILGSANIGDTPNLQILNNWVDGGHCTVKLENASAYALNATVTGNKFGPNRAVKYCPMQVTPTVSFVSKDNVYEGTTDPIAIYRGN
jgi:hypothetical protein